MIYCCFVLLEQQQAHTNFEAIFSVRRTKPPPHRQVYVLSQRDGIAGKQFVDCQIALLTSKPTVAALICLLGVCSMPLCCDGRHIFLCVLHVIWCT